jgi:hypothetical protein
MPSTGSMWLYDPEMQRRDPEKIYAFWLAIMSMNEYPKSQIKERLVTVKDHRRQKIVAAYLKWKKDNGAAFVEESRNPAEALRKKTISRHRDRLEELGVSYKGVCTGQYRSYRSTHCYFCKTHLQTGSDLECAACNWLLCACGACGCGFGNL